MFYNDTDAPNADGVPAHSIEVLVLGGLDQAIADALWSVAGGSGIHLHGSTTKTVVDSQGNTQTVRFSRPTQVPIYVVADVTYDNTPGVFPSNGGTQIQNALATFGRGYSIGRIVAQALEAMRDLEGGAIANPDEGRMVGHYWLRDAAKAPTPELRKEIAAIVRAEDFASPTATSLVRRALAAYRKAKGMDG